MATPVLVNGPTGVLATAIQIAGQDCQVFGYHIYNPSNATAYVQFFDGTGAPTVGTDKPKWSIGVTTLTNVDMPVNGSAGLFFRGGCWVAAATSAGGNSAPSSAVNVNLAIGT